MSIFFNLISKIFPLYLFILIGYFANKKLAVTKDGIARLLIYVFAPAIVFLGTINAKESSELFLIPVIYFVVGGLLCIAAAIIARKIWKDGTEKVAAFIAGTGNTGYFGLPVCLAIVGEDALAIVAMVSIGLILFENMIGFYVVARASYSPRKALQKVLHLPSIYAFLGALIINLFDITLNKEVVDFFSILKGGYVPLGMMIIGLGIAEIKPNHLDFKFGFFTLFNKFIVWPIIFLGIIYIDKAFSKIFNQVVYLTFMIESIVPIASNAVTYATELKVHPQKVAFVVVISTLIALVYIPVMVTLFL
ncbi:AEC family transporter [Candidatus Peregrinibacteria bacterium]|nr:AEC family transporter [Candidatus Peregrinibacteria bacterium]